MNNIFDASKLEKLSVKCNTSKRIIIIAHTNPDGDAIGSGLALLFYLRKKFEDKEIRFIVPNRFPDFLSWLDPKHDAEVFAENCGQATAFIAASDLIFVLDFSQTSRLEKMSAALDANIHAPRILIDHHISPSQFDMMFHNTESSSTAFLVYNLIEKWDGTSAITKPIAEALYVGMMTDTGCFSYGNLAPELYRAVAVLVEKGMDAMAVNRAIYNTQSESRLRMVGYLISQKMVVHADKKAAYITMTIEEKERFNHRIGDTEGVVNLPLTIGGIEFSGFMVENKDHVKISLRSAGDLDVNVLCNRYFNGGGHHNAAGGKFVGTMAQAEAEMNRVISLL